MHKYHHYFFFSLILIFASCKKPVTTQPVAVETPNVVEIGGQKYSPAEFKASYDKNKYVTDSGKALTPEEYLPLFTDAKLKVLSAKSLGKDTTTDYKEEIASYRQQLAKDFVKDKDLIEKFSHEAYDRMKQEVKASHILIPVAEYASPADTLEAYRAAIAMRGRVEEGSDFGDLAARFSKDPSAKMNKGNLGYFTVFQTLYPFEKAAYTTSVGKVSQPVRTKSGYHIIKVTDKRTNRGTIQIAHIMIKADTNSTQAQKEAARTRIADAYSRLQNGETWESVVSEYSDDQQSKRNGGKLPVFGIGQMVTEIEDASFTLNTPGAYSKPVKTIYGWHIVKLIEKKPIESYDNLAPSLRQRVVTDSRGKVIEQLHAKQLKEKFKPVEYPEAWARLQQLVDSSLISGKWDYMKPVGDNWAEVNLFSIESNPYNALSFLIYAKANQQAYSKGSADAVIFRKYYTDYLDQSLSAYETEHLEESNPGFKDVMSDIKEGVLLSQEMEKNVWERSLVDSAGQLALYQQHMDRYKFPERAFATVITAPDTQTISSINRALSANPYLLARKSEEILFDENKAEITNAYEKQLTDLYVILTKNPDYLVEVAGYQTSSETPNTSSARIRSVVKFLVSKNIPLIRIIEKDYSSFRPSAETERNRRASFQFLSQSKKDVEKVYNELKPGSVTIQEGYFTQDAAALKGTKWQVGISTVGGENGLTRQVNIQRIEPPRGKKFNEARGSVINDYQKELEKEWINSLKTKFPVKVSTAELEKIKP